MEDGRLGGTLLATLLRRGPAEQARVVAFPTGAPLPTPGPAHSGPRYRGNRTSTTKYTLLSFLPKALFEQYRCGARRSARNIQRRVRQRSASRARAAAGEAMATQAGG